MKNPSVDIGPYRISTDSTPFIVAEVGINHNGDLHRAKSMIEVAKAAGCNAVKFQTFKADEFVADPSQMFSYKSNGVTVTESMLEMFKRNELPEAAWDELKAECERIGIIFLSTPQNVSDLDILCRVGISAIKVGSDDLTNTPLLERFSKSGLPMILSIGMSSLAEVFEAVEVIGGFDGYPLILLVCTSQYPTPPEDANLRRICALRAAFPMLPIGFSDHSQGSLASSLAVALGACFFEKHFTLSRDLPGPDHWFSEDPEGLRIWVDSIRTAADMLGSPLIRPTITERKNKKEYQRILVAAKDIRLGEIMTEEAITARRVSGGNGFPPSMLRHFLGRPSTRQYSNGNPIEI